MGIRIPLSSCNTTLDPLPIINPPIGVPADDDGICIDEGVCVVVEIKLVASTCFIDGDAGSRPEFCRAAEGIRKGSTVKEGRTSGYSALVSEESDENLRIRTPLFWRDLQNHIKPTTRTASTKKPITPPMIGPMMTVDLPLALLELIELDIADVVNVPEPPELDAGVLELDAGMLELDAGMLELDVKDFAAGDEAPAVVVGPIRLSLKACTIYN